MAQEGKIGIVVFGMAKDFRVEGCWASRARWPVGCVMQDIFFIGDRGVLGYLLAVDSLSTNMTKLR